MSLKSEETAARELERILQTLFPLSADTVASTRRGESCEAPHKWGKKSEISMYFSCFSYLSIDFLYVSHSPYSVSFSYFFSGGYYSAVIRCRITYIDVVELFGCLLTPRAQWVSVRDFNFNDSRIQQWAKLEALEGENWSFFILFLSCSFLFLKLFIHLCIIYPVFDFAPFRCRRRYIFTQSAPLLGPRLLGERECFWKTMRCPIRRFMVSKGSSMLE